MIPFPLFDAQVRFLESCWFSEEGKHLLGGNGKNLRNQYFEEETLKRSTYPEHYAHRMHDGMQWEYLVELERLTFSGVPDNVKESMEVSRKFYEHAVELFKRGSKDILAIDKTLVLKNNV